MSKKSNYDIVMEYAESIASGKKIACRMLVLAAKRFLGDLKNDKYEFRTKDAEFVIRIIERTLCHKQGEDLNGKALRGKPFLLEPYHKFIIYNLLGFFIKGTDIRRFKEAYIYIPRKNIKTTFAAALAYSLGILNRISGSKIYLNGASLKQALESFDFLLYNIDRIDPDRQSFKVINNNNEHSISMKFPDGGSMEIIALACNPDVHDSFNCNYAICDEMHAYKKPKQYTLFKDAMKAYTNKLMIGITTAGDNSNSFNYKKLEACRKILDGTAPDETYFVFIAEADKDENGEVDYTNPKIHEMANPAYGVTIRPEEILNDSIQAQNDPQLRKDFYAKSLNVYTAAMKAYFNIDEFRRSDSKYDWTISELADMKIKWYGGSDLSKLYDLTAATSVGLAGDVLVIIPHCWFPVLQAAKKAEEDNIPLFGWKEDGWLDMSNSPTVNHAEVVQWYIGMKQKGFKFKKIGHDRKFCREYFILMKKKGFNIQDQPQYFYKKSEGFRYIEKKAKDGKLYYLHAEPFEYCVQNVSAIEKTDDMIQYEKVSTEMRIDVFDAAVFGTVAMIEDMENGSKLKKYYGKE